MQKELVYLQDIKDKYQTQITTENNQTKISFTSNKKNIQVVLDDRYPISPPNIYIDD